MAYDKKFLLRMINDPEIDEKEKNDFRDFIKKHEGADYFDKKSEVKEEVEGMITKVKIPAAKKTKKSPKKKKKVSEEIISKAKAAIKKRTGKTEEECEKIVGEYKKLRGKATKRKKKETERVSKLKKDGKVIKGTDEKTPAATIDTTARQVEDKIEKAADKIERKAIKEVSTKNISASDKKEEVSKKVSKKIAAMTRSAITSTNKLISSTLSELKKVDKTEAKDYLLGLRAKIDTMLKKFNDGGMVQGYDIQEGLISVGNNSSYEHGGSLDREIYNYAKGGYVIEFVDRDGNVLGEKKLKDIEEDGNPDPDYYMDKAIELDAYRGVVYDHKGNEISDLLIKEDEHYAKGGSVDNNFTDNVNQWVMHSYNWNTGADGKPAFFEAFGEPNSSLRNHLYSKWKRYYDTEGSGGVMNRFWTELSSNNQVLLANWIKENYTSYAHGGSVSSLKGKLKMLDKDGNLTYPEKSGNFQVWGYEDYANDIYRDGFKSEKEAYEDAIAYLSEGKTKRTFYVAWDDKSGNGEYAELEADSYDEAVEIIEKNEPKGIEFRHDLGYEIEEEDYAHGGKIDKDIAKFKKQLIAKEKSRGLYENFGRNEVRKLNDKYDSYEMGDDGVKNYTKIQQFSDWASGFDGTRYSKGGTTMVRGKGNSKEWKEYQVASDNINHFNRQNEFIEVDGESVANDVTKMPEYKILNKKFKESLKKVKQKGYAKGGMVNKIIGMSKQLSNATDTETYVYPVSADVPPKFYMELGFKSENKNDIVRVIEIQFDTKKIVLQGYDDKGENYEDVEVYKLDSLSEDFQKWIVFNLLLVSRREKGRDSKFSKGGSINMDKHIWEGWSVGDFIEHLDISFRHHPKFESRDEVKKWAKSEQPYYKKYIPEVVNHFWDKSQNRHETWGFEKGGKTWVQDVEDSKSFDKGGFSREAASRGMSTQQLFNKVMKNPQSEPEHLYRQAMFMKNAYNFK